MVDVMALQADFESELKEMQNLQKDMKRLAESRQQLIEQQSECEIVKKVAISFNLAKKKKKKWKHLGSRFIGGVSQGFQINRERPSEAEHQGMQNQRRQENRIH